MFSDVVFVTHAHAMICLIWYLSVIMSCLSDSIWCHAWLRLFWIAAMPSHLSIVYFVFMSCLSVWILDIGYYHGNCVVDAILYYHVSVLLCSDRPHCIDCLIDCVIVFCIDQHYRAGNNNAPNLSIIFEVWSHVMRLCLVMSYCFDVSCELVHVTHFWPCIRF